MRFSYIFMLVKRFFNFSFVEVRLTSYKLCFISLKSNRSRKHGSFRGVLVSRYYSLERGFAIQLDKTLDSKFYCLKCFKIISGTKHNSLIHNSSECKSRMEKGHINFLFDPGKHRPTQCTKCRKLISIETIFMKI